MKLIPYVEEALNHSVQAHEELRQTFAKMASAVCKLAEQQHTNSPLFRTTFDQTAQVIRLGFEDVNLQFRLVIANDLQPERRPGPVAAVQVELISPRAEQAPERIGSFEFSNVGWTDFTNARDEQVRVQYSGGEIALHYLALVIARKDR